MATLIETAFEIKKWARKNQLLGNPPIQLDTNVVLIRSYFGRVGIPQAINILQSRKISFIGIDPDRKQIIIFTERALTKANASVLAPLARAQGDQYEIIFREGRIPHVGAKLGAPFVTPFD